MERKTILLIDDDRVILDVLGEILRRGGYAVMVLSEAAAALETGLQGAPIDLVITDYQMAGMDGLELLRRLKEDRMKVPVIMLTGFGTLESYQKAANLGIAAYVRKPVRGRELLDVVRRVLEGDAQGVVVSPPVANKWSSISSVRFGRGKW